MDISRRQLLRGRVSLEDLSGSQFVDASSRQREDVNEPVKQSLEISKECLAFNQVSCRSCQDACEPQAIRFHLQIGKPASPSIDPDQCTVCGECISICPSRAISIGTKETVTTDTSATIGARQ